MLGLGVGFYRLGGHSTVPWDPKRVSLSSGARLALFLAHNTGVTAGQWDDSSDEANHATQGTSGNQATVDAGGLDFNATNEDHYDIEGIECSSQEAFTVFIVIEPDAVSNATLLGIGNQTEFLEIHTQKKLRIRIDLDTDIIEFSSTQFPSGSKYVLCVERESGETGNINVYKNGVLLTPTSQQANAGAITFNTIGDGGGRRFFDGHIYELLVYDTENLSSTDMTTVNDYLVTKHGLK